MLVPPVPWAERGERGLSVPWKSLETELTRQARIAIHIDTADRSKRIATSALVLALLWGKGEMSYLGIFLAVVVVFELWFEIVRRKALLSPAEIGQPLALLHISNGVLGMVVFMLPAVLLALIPGQANIVSSLFWICGISIHIANRYVLLLHYFWSKNIVILIASFLTVTIISFAEPMPSGSVDWSISFVLFIVLYANMVEAISQHKDTRQALANAQDNAETRLRELEHIMRHDPLTGLLRRTAFDEELERKMLTDHSRHNQLAVMIIDLDGFKPINDTYGHSAGDHLLKIIGARLQAHSQLVAARLGGDEFGVFVDGLKCPEDAVILAMQLREQLIRPVDWEGKTLSVGASIGVNMYQNGSGELETLCAGADQAMYHAKGGTSEGVVLFDPDLFNPRLNLIDRQVFLDAMAALEIRAYYQPKVDLQTREIVGFEALARWPDPDGGPLRMPGEFLPQIAELQLQSEFVSYMTRQVVIDISALLKKGYDPGQVAINLPEVALTTKSALDDLLWILSEHGEVIPHVTFEITEDVLIARAGDIIRDSIDQLSNRGARISLDDFGTGFASFQHLRQLTFDELKIDTSFVSGLGRDTVSDVIVDGFLSIARGLGVAAVAEGVETEAQAQHLAKLGCQYGQGYLFGRALPLDRAEVLLTEPFRSTGT